MYNRGQRISSGNRIQSRRHAALGRQQSCVRQGERPGHHRGLRAGHVFRGVNRELGRASRLLGSNSRTTGDRRNQHPGVCWSTRPAGEPIPAQAGRDTNRNASTQGTGREHKADRPGRTEAVVATTHHRFSGERAGPVMVRLADPCGTEVFRACYGQGKWRHRSCREEKRLHPEVHVLHPQPKCFQ